MNIYSNSFFQRVKEYAIAQSILEEGFKAFYCKEEIFRGQNKLSTYIGIPMICFCDIPLVHVAKNNYGNVVLQCQDHGAGEKVGAGFILSK